jgi:hypothetical protein
MALTNLTNRGAISSEVVANSIADLKTRKLKSGSLAKTLGYFAIGDGGFATYLNRGQGWPVTADGYVHHSDTEGNFLELQIKDSIAPEQAGVIGSDRASTATIVNTTNLQALINVASRHGHEIKLSAGQKYKSGKLYFYQDAINNTVAGGYAGRTGRFKMTGHATGLFTGDDEESGAALIHIDGEAGTFIDVQGNFTLLTAGQSGGHLEMDSINLVGGNTTDLVMDIVGSQARMSFKSMTVRIYNPSCGGIREATTWETTWENILIRGDGDSDNPTGWTGVGLDITAALDTDIADGQNNMKIYRNVNVYKMGTNIEIGRKAVEKGTFAPLVFIGGQCSQAENHNLVVGGGVYANVFIGWQSEGARKNGVLIDRNTPVTANDLPRSIKFISCYLTNNGRIENGTSDEYQVCVKEADGVEFDTPVLQNSRSGFYIDSTGDASNVLLRRPLFRTVKEYGTLSGKGITVVGGAVSRLKIEDPTFNQNFSLNIDDPSSSLARSAAGGLANSTGGNTTPTIVLTHGDSAGILNFNNALATTVTDILVPSTTYAALMEFKILHITFSNVNTTISSNANIFLNGNVNFVPNTSRGSLTLMYRGGAWQELSRSLG